MSDDDSEDEELLQYKVILLGDGTVGKTSIAMRFTNDTFGQQYKQTIGLDFMLKRLVLPKNTRVALQIWDIGGQSIGSKMLGNYIFGSQAILVCYDITNHQSFQNAEDWIALVKKVFTDRTQLPYMALVGNKVDMSHLRSVKSDRHTSLVEQHGMRSFYVSAKTGDNVNTCFYRVASELAGVALTKPEMEVASKVVKAEIVDYPDVDKNQAQLGQQAKSGSTAGDGAKQKKDGKSCSVQ